MTTRMTVSEAQWAAVENALRPAFAIRMTSHPDRLRRTVHVFRRRYGNTRLPLLEIGNELGISRERVRQINAEGLRYVRRCRRSLEGLLPHGTDFHDAVFGCKPLQECTVPGQHGEQPA